MSNETTIVFGVPVASVDPFFLAVVRGGSGRGENQYQQLEHLTRQFDDDQHVQAMVIDRKHEVVLASQDRQHLALFHALHAEQDPGGLVDINR